MSIQEYVKAHGFASCQQITYGWSEDQKYLVSDHENHQYVVRVSDASKKVLKRKEFAFIQACNSLSYAMSQAISISVSDQVYMLLSYVPGCMLETILPSMMDETAYRLGIQAGSALIQIHQLPNLSQLAYKVYDPIALRQKVLHRLTLYETEGFCLPQDQRVLSFVREHIDNLYQNQPCYLHGDYHCGNLLYTNGGIGIIDFNRFDYSDPYEEFARLDLFDVPASKPYANGLLHGYFRGNPPEDFWKFYAVYMAYTSLYSLVWAKPFGNAEVDGFIQRYLHILTVFDGFQKMIPSWYHPDI